MNADGFKLGKLCAGALREPSAMFTMITAFSHAAGAIDGSIKLLLPVQFAAIHGMRSSIGLQNFNLQLFQVATLCV